MIEEFAAQLTKMRIEHVNLLEHSPRATDLVVLSTLDSAYRFKAPVRDIVIDEAAQASCVQVITLLTTFPKLFRLVLVGDPLQLSPLSLSKQLRRTLVLSGALAVLDSLDDSLLRLDEQFRASAVDMSSNHRLGTKPM